MRIGHLYSYFYGRGNSGYIGSLRNNFSSKVYYQHRSASSDNYVRIWTPINHTYAQYWDIQDHGSPDEDYINFGRGGVVEYYELRNPDSHTGTLAGEGTSTSYLSTQGGTITITFHGSALYFKHFADNRGGLMQFELDGGEESITISTFAASGQRKRQLLFSNLDPSVEHTVVGTFIGDDPDNAPSGGVSRGWCATDNTTSGAQCHEKAFWVVGSPNPNSAFPYTQMAGQQYDGIEFVGFSNKEFAFSMRKNGSAVAYKHVPNHELTGNATTFADLATDRTLKADGGSNVLGTFTTVTLATEASSIELRQVFKGHNTSEPSEELIDVDLSITWTHNGPKVSGRIEAIQDIDADILYHAMFPVSTSKFDTMLYKEGEKDTTITDGSSETLYDTSSIGNWDGNAVYVNKVGTDEELQYALGFRLSSPRTALKLESSYGQYLFLQHRDTTLQKLYPVIADGVIIPTGTVWQWEAQFTCQMLADAYNQLK